MANQKSQIENRKFPYEAFGWLALCALTGLAVLLLWRDGCQADGGLHYVLARWAWQHPALFVDVWARPLFTFLYAFPALIGYQAARTLTIIVCVITAHQTWRLADEHGLARAPLVIPFLFLQPSFALFIADTMTEPLYALVFVIALRLHLKGRIAAAALTASLLILIRPEGFFTIGLWALWLLKLRTPHSALRIPLLGAGMFAWWLASWLITGDALFIKHNWPANWPFSGTMYGAPGFLNYPARLPEIIGPLFLIPFAVGLWRYLKHRSAVAQDGILCCVGAAWLSLFLIHTVMRAFGLMGSAGYPRYVLTVAPAAALLTLIGWNALADKFSHRSLSLRRAVTVTVIALSFCLNALYVDGAEWMRDAVLVDRVFVQWAQWPQHQRPITRFIWSQPYMAMRFNADPWQNEFFTTDKVRNAQLMQAMPAGTLVFWDRLTGPKWTDVKIEDFQANGFELLYEEQAVLKGYVIPRSFFGVGGPRHQRMALLYKPAQP